MKLDQPSPRGSFGFMWKVERSLGINHFVFVTWFPVTLHRWQTIVDTSGKITLKISKGYSSTKFVWNTSNGYISAIYKDMTSQLGYFTNFKAIFLEVSMDFHGLDYIKI